MKTEKYKKQLLFWYSSYLNIYNFDTHCDTLDVNIFKLGPKSRSLMHEVMEKQEAIIWYQLLVWCFFYPYLHSSYPVSLFALHCSTELIKASFNQHVLAMAEFNAFASTLCPGITVDKMDQSSLYAGQWKIQFHGK